jgi:signal transduction histidine kinase
MVLHNIRNSLSPLRAILTHLGTRQQLVAPENLDRAFQELGRRDLAPERQDKLLEFVRAVLDQYKEQVETSRIDIASANLCLYSIVEVIEGLQQERSKGVMADGFNLPEVVRLSVEAGRFGSEGRIEMQLPDRPVRVSGSRLLISQVLGNLITNSIESLEAGRTSTPKIRVSCALVTDQNQQWGEIQVVDNGEGFPADDAQSLFERGYSTRVHKTGGQGLHWCANVVRSMGGSLSLTSEGRGKGAIASVRLPLAEATVNGEGEGDQAQAA